MCPIYDKDVRRFVKSFFQGTFQDWIWLTGMYLPSCQDICNLTFEPSNKTDMASVSDIQQGCERFCQIILSECHWQGLYLPSCQDICNLTFESLNDTETAHVCDNSCNVAQIIPQSQEMSCCKESIQISKDKQLLRPAFLSLSLCYHGSQWFPIMNDLLTNRRVHPM